MRILDRYMAKQFLIALLLSFVTFIAIFVIVDLIDHLDTFIDYNATVATVVQYYLCFIPYRAVLCLPIAMLLACLFSIGMLAKHNEIVAMKAAGMSLYRILYPAISLALIISLAALIFSDQVVPWANWKKGQIWRNMKGTVRSRGSRRDVFLQDVNDQIVFARYYNTGEKTAYEVSIETYRDASLIRRVTAQKMSWANESWILSEGEVREFERERERARPFDRMQAEDVTLLPEDFAREYRKPEEMSYFELRAYIKRAVRIGVDATRYLVDLHLKISFPFASFIIILFGAPIASNPRRAGLAMSFGTGLLICFAYYGLIKAGQALGWNQVISPLLAAWIGNLVFAAFGIVLLIKTHK